MRKIIFRVALAIVLLFFLGLFSLLYWLEGDGFRNWVSHRIDDELAKYHLCLHAEQLRAHPLQFQAEYNNLAIYVCGEKEPLISARHVFIQVRVKSLFEQKFELGDLILDQ